MSIRQEITWKSLPIETSNQFTANFNNPVGQYGFTQVAGNADQVLINMNPNYIYLIDRVSFSASIAEATYLDSLGVNAVQPQLRIRFLKQSGALTYPFPFPAINYKNNLEFSLWLRSPKRADQALISMTGVINQVAATVAIPTILAFASFVIYEENNLTKITKMLGATKPGIGREYVDGD
jgi:hypothetical protein